MIKIRIGQKIQGDNNSFFNPSTFNNGLAIQSANEPVIEKTNKIIKS